MFFMHYYRISKQAWGNCALPIDRVFDPRIDGAQNPLFSGVSGVLSLTCGPHEYNIFSVFGQRSPELRRRRSRKSIRHAEEISNLARRSVKMAKAMTKSQIVGKLAEGANLPKKQIAALLEDLVQMAYKEAKNGFTIPGLGKLVLMKRKARMGRNPQTGEQIKIPARTVLKFRIAKAAKDTVLKK
jgi:DNA-binding protein HU-beta